MLSRFRSARLPAFLIACGLALAGPAALHLATAGPTPYPAIPPTLTTVTRITTKAGTNGAAAIAATGSLMWPAGDLLTVGQQLVLTDALGASVTFQIALSTDPPGGNPNLLPIVGNHWTANQVASNAYVVFANGGCGLDTSSGFSGPTVTIADLTAGAAGNVAITSTITTPGFSLTGMSGGANAVANGNGVDFTIANGAAGTGGAGGTAGKVHFTRSLQVDGVTTSTGGFVGALTGNASTATTATNFSGSLAGDVTGTQSATTLASSGVTAATYGSATSVAVVTADAKGRITSAATTAIAIAATAITSGQLSGNRGGTGQDFGASTGRPRIAAGTWSTAQIDLTSEVTGALPAGNLASTAVTPGSYGSGTATGTFTVDQQGRITAASSTTIATVCAGCSGICETFTADTGGVTAQMVVVFSGAGKVQNAGASLNLTTIAGVATTTATSGNPASVCTLGTAVVKSVDANCTAGATASSSAANAGNAQCTVAVALGGGIGRVSTAQSGSTATIYVNPF